MRFGRFDDKNREYVITTPKTPLPWINYLGSKDYYAMVSNTGGGYSFFKDARLLRLTRYRYNDVPADNNGKYFYIKDGDCVWNPGWLPTRTPLDAYECRHGMGYTRFLSEKNGLSASLLHFVPLGDPCELMLLTLTNTGSAPKSPELFSYLEWCLWDADDDQKNFQRNLSTGEVEIESTLGYQISGRSKPAAAAGIDCSGIGYTAVYHRTEYRERRSHYAVFSVNSPVDSYDTDRGAFIGSYRGPQDPEAVERGACSGSVAMGWSPVAAFGKKLELAPGGSVTLVFQLAFVENEPYNKWEAPGIINKQKARELILKYADSASVEKAFEELQAYWDELLSRFSVKSGRPEVDRLVNIWHPYQCMVTFNMSRSASYYESGIGRGMGFRDSCQDLLGFVHLIPGRARERLLDIAATQLPDGSAYHQYQPLTKKGNADIGGGFNDDPLWLVAAVSAYVRETGDLSILSEDVPFDNDISQAGPMLEHLRKSIGYTLSHLGPHGLPLIGRADWNDCLNLNCFSDHPGESFQTTGPSEGPVAESVFIGGMFVRYAEEYAVLCELMGLSEEAEAVRAEKRKMEASVLRDGWDGHWFLRAYDAFGNKVGSSECEEGRIFIEPQGFCVMAGIGLATGQAAEAMDSVREHLDTDYGIMLHQPAFTRYHLELGEISSYPPGYKENAGIFCHNNPWCSIAETVLGRGGRAFEIYWKTAPSRVEAFSERHKTEPYVYSQMVAGNDAVLPGEAKNSWLTGTAAWTYVNISQYILGLCPSYAGLTVDPCLPADFGDLRLSRCFREGTYDIRITNPDHVEKGVRKLIVDGEDLGASTLIPYVKGKTHYEVQVVMGKDG